ncbi:hypothetical protein CONPUDRAFT_169644 [Coniophora puteana RWD-64-598 SS2]|uniref:F-box domain-containing protein n=1 Tax=Coniophora puteana (strain RWD-64-598) TaxID=741705 RepID=A0A5M3M7Q3_CONPW|nr:uncharacterized protein CONPUDRAFT_169644 [Coniophora puteana RWD-64-598 SS2]EIW75259.1 hypothetical protein CONPUDRAFT_169644 [Coniophora puteana RWD-64-598 SS2]
MGQYWMFLNLDRHEQVGGLGKLGEFFGDGSTNRSIATRLCRLRPLPKIPRIQPSEVESTNIEFPKRGLLALPNEILLHIADVVRSSTDLVCFAATCHRFWYLCSPAIETAMKTVSWAGCRIIGLGDYMQNDDLPAGMLTDAEQAALGGLKPDEDGERPSLYNHARENYPDAIVSSSFSRVRNAYLRPLEKRGIKGAPMAAIERMCTPVEPTVLRNLSKKLYVSAAAIDALNKEISQKFDGEWAYTLGDALVGRICWSSDPSCSMPENCDDITRGPWAGDAFDMTSMEIFQKEADFSQWVDAKDEVCEALLRYLDGC